MSMHIREVYTGSDYVVDFKKMTCEWKSEGRTFQVPIESRNNRLCYEEYGGSEWFELGDAFQDVYKDYLAETILLGQDD